MEHPDTNVDASPLVVRVEQKLPAMSPEQKAVIDALSRALGGGQLDADTVKLLADTFEISRTDSAFRDERKRGIIEATAQDYPFSRWLHCNSLPSAQATRVQLCEWWDTFMQMTGEKVCDNGKIDQVSRAPGGVNLWKATHALAEKLKADPAAYKFFPWALLNNPHEVQRVLREITQPKPFKEVLVGETAEDMATSPTFMGAFSAVTKPNSTEISRTVGDAIFSVHMILQRG